MSCLLINKTTKARCSISCRPHWLTINKYYGEKIMIISPEYILHGCVGWRSLEAHDVRVVLKVIGVENLVPKRRRWIWKHGLAPASALIKIK